MTVSSGPQAAAMDLVRQGVLGADVTPDNMWWGYAGADTLNRVFAGQPAVPEGIGFQIVDATHNLPASGIYRQRDRFHRRLRQDLDRVVTPLISADQPAAIDVAGLRVSFAGTCALDGIDLRISAGRIHGLLGGNGSGKSTLIKVLAGVQKADTGGTVSLFGRTYPADQLTPSVAMEAGLRFVHQDLGMFDDMTVAENFALYARYPTATAGRVNWRALHAEVGQLLERFEIDATPRTKTVHLRPAMRTMLAVARALRGDGGNGERVLILDEPTVSLLAAEVDSLLEALRRRAASGETIVFVGHRLAEVLSLADDLTVVRDGSVVARLDAGSTTQNQLVELIAGRPISNIYPPASEPMAARPYPS